ncbi:MAG: hypothetical protein RR214_00500 [Synergistaceae bacterium]
MKIYAPNRQYSGVSAGVRFIDGIGETEDLELIAWFSEHGYETDAEEEKKRKKKSAEEQ